MLPKSVSNRGQNSIKFMGPKAWVTVPNHLKQIAFSKSFSRKLKEYILSTIYVELPTKSTCHTNTNGQGVSLDDLRVLFDSSDEEGDFLGFDNTTQNSSDFDLGTRGDIFRQSINSPNIREIFESSDEEGDFLGFLSTSQK